MNVTHSKKIIAILSFFLLFSFNPAHSLELKITPATASAIVGLGDTFTVTGTVTNLTEADLFTSDIFINFSGYPAGVLELEQLLGNPNFILPDRTISSDLDLFLIRLLPTALPGETYVFDFFANDINGVFTEPSVFSVVAATENPPSEVPEPASTYIFLLGALLLLSRFLTPKKITK